MKSLQELRKTLFWDADLKNLDEQEDADFITARVLDFGNLREWKVVKDFYGYKKVKETAENHIFSDPRSANFWAVILDIPLEKIKCTRNPSLKIPKTFSAR